MAMIPWAEWRPDMPALSQWAREALNVIPLEESYGPLRALVGVTNALHARPLGAAWFNSTSDYDTLLTVSISDAEIIDGAILEFSPEELDFSSIAVGEESEVMMMTVTNTGSDDVEVDGITVSGDFEIVSMTSE